jgi:hypothetical protein
VTGGAAEPEVPMCPSRALAMKLLGNPSCSEAIESIDSDGTYDAEADVCCYEVTTKSRSCSSAEDP